MFQIAYEDTRSGLTVYPQPSQFYSSSPFPVYSQYPQQQQFYSYQSTPSYPLQYAGVTQAPYLQYPVEGYTVASVVETALPASYGCEVRNSIIIVISDSLNITDLYLYLSGPDRKVPSN